MRRTLLLAALAAVLLAPVRLFAQPDTSDTRMLHMPAVSATHVAFTFAHDTARGAPAMPGGRARPPTSDRGLEPSPVSPPAGPPPPFSAEYEATLDVSPTPVAGGPPTRLTWHPGGDHVRGWTPDGSAVLFSSQRAAFNGRYRQPFTVPPEGGVATLRPVPHSIEACHSPQRSHLAYPPLSHP